MGKLSSYMLKAKQTQMEQEFLSVYEGYSDAVFRFCYLRLFERELAKDFMQQAFLKTWEYLSTGKQVDNLKAFVFKVARNLIIDYKRVKKESLSVESLVEEGYEVVKLEMDWNLKIDLQKLKSLLNELDDLHSEVLNLRYIEGFGPKEIALIVGESENVVSVRINRGLKKMKELVKKYEIF